MKEQPDTVTCEYWHLGTRSENRVLQHGTDAKVSLRQCCGLQQPWSSSYIYSEFRKNNNFKTFLKHCSKTADTFQSTKYVMLNNSIFLPIKVQQRKLHWICNLNTVDQKHDPVLWHEASLTRVAPSQRWNRQPALAPDSNLHPNQVIYTVTQLPWY